MAKQLEITQAEIDQLIKRIEAVKLPCVGWFNDVIKTNGGWQKSSMGPKPTDTEMKLGQLIYMAKRLGVELGYVQMLLRANGCTDAEHAAAFHCKTAHNNAFGVSTPSMVTMGVAERQVIGGVKPYRNKLTITPKGWRIVEAELTKLEGAVNTTMPANAPSKPAGKAKAKKATKVAKAKKPTSKAPKATVTVDAPQVETNGAVQPIEPVTVEPVNNEQLAALASHFNS